MTPLIIAGIVLIACAFLAGVVVGVTASRRDRKRDRALILQLKELVWNHRELDDSLARIVIDEIATHERKHPA